MKTKTMLMMIFLGFMLISGCTRTVSNNDLSRYILSDFMPDSELVKYYYGDVEDGGAYSWVLPTSAFAYEAYYVTTMGSQYETFEKVDHEIIRTYYRGGEGGYKDGREIYDKQIVLKEPLEVGQSWQNTSFSGDEITFTITAVDVVREYQGKAHDCIEVTTSDGSQMYYAPKLGFVELISSIYPIKLAQFESNPLLPETDSLDEKINYLDLMRAQSIYESGWFLKLMSPERPMVKFFSDDQVASDAIRIITDVNEEGYQEIYGTSSMYQVRRYRYTADGLVMDYLMTWDDVNESIPLSVDEESNANELIIKTPIKLGQQWETMASNRTITQVPTQYKVVGESSNYLEITVQSSSGETYKEYYDMALGFVKRVNVNSDLSNTEIYDYRDIFLEQNGITVEAVQGYLNE